MSHDEPSLFDYQPPAPDQGAPQGATMLPFPMDRDVGRIRRTARNYLSKTTDKMREGYWANTAGKAAKSMAASGLSDAQIQTQIDRFAAAVGREIDRLQNEERRRM